MRMHMFFVYLVVPQCQSKNKTYGNSPSRAFTVTPSAGQLPTTAAKEQALLQELIKITSLKIFSLLCSDYQALELAIDRPSLPLEITKLSF
jgi:hypothetical protein